MRDNTNGRAIHFRLGTVEEVEQLNAQWMAAVADAL
jgi:hypothetical protein